MRVEFPNPFPNEFGIRTSRGIASYRAIQALYQAWRLKTLSLGSKEPIIEIGSGLGRTAFYAWRMGLQSYGIVDFPMTTVAQAPFLAHVVGADNITLPSEPSKKGCINISTPAEFAANSSPVGIVVNIDSMTEMDQSHAQTYASAIVDRARLFLSINHEFNPFRVADLPAFTDVARQRYPYWMRKGYAEEVFTISRAPD